MNVITKQHLTQSYKPCAAKGCSNPGVYEIEILFLGRKGWFCEQCKYSLMCDGLLIQQAATTSDCHSSTQGENNR